MEVLRKKVKTALSKSGIPGLDFALNPYIGCIHNCIYCYARCYVDRDVAERWGEIVIVKDNLLNLLRKEKKVGVVGIGTITDAYQKIEEKEEVTRKAVKILLSKGAKISIQTKSDLVVRDLDIFKKESVDVGFTITTLEKSKAKILEPNAPSPEKRVKALEKLSSEGLKTWIFLGPIVPNVSIEEIEEIVEVAASSGSHLYYDKFRVKNFMKEGYIKELAEEAKKVNWKDVFSKIEEVCRKYKVKAFPAFFKKNRKF
ncbi:MAG: radical SAM protein [Archaeoglobaceae archaeon]|nr:radical SAM protein [Archaeoglobaceae archaeon]MCX8152421.1 radical SAM protein [Archaeoglobaceae archaeon]MDW8013761.1 radical SAM protein [Archaeoglobaceae archaeon]